MYAYKTYIVMTSIYYGILAIVLPLIYAVTNDISIFAVFGLEWLSVSLFLYPAILILATISYFFFKRKKLLANRMINKKNQKTPSV